LLAPPFRTTFLLFGGGFALPFDGCELLLTALRRSAMMLKICFVWFFL